MSLAAHLIAIRQDHRISRGSCASDIHQNGCEYATDCLLLLVKMDKLKTSSAFAKDLHQRLSQVQCIATSLSHLHIAVLDPPVLDSSWHILLLPAPT